MIFLLDTVHSDCPISFNSDEEVACGFAEFKPELIYFFADLCEPEEVELETAICYFIEGDAIDEVGEIFLDSRGLLECGITIEEAAEQFSDAIYFEVIYPKKVKR